MSTALPKKYRWILWNIKTNSDCVFKNKLFPQILSWFGSGFNQNIFCLSYYTCMYNSTIAALKRMKIDNYYKMLHVHVHAHLFFHMWWYGKATYFILVQRNISWFDTSIQDMHQKRKNHKFFWNTHKMQVTTYQEINIIPLKGLWTRTCRRSTLHLRSKQTIMTRYHKIN